MSGDARTSRNNGRATSAAMIQASGPLAKMLVMPKAARPGMTATTRPAMPVRMKMGSA